MHLSHWGLAAPALCRGFQTTAPPLLLLLYLESQEDVKLHHPVCQTAKTLAAANVTEG